jgi:hypothetical protein
MATFHLNALKKFWQNFSSLPAAFVKIGGQSVSSVQIEIKPFMKQLRQGFAITPRSDSREEEKYR